MEEKTQVLEKGRWAWALALMARHAAELGEEEWGALGQAVLPARTESL